MQEIIFKKRLALAIIKAEIKKPKLNFWQKLINFLF